MLYMNGLESSMLMYREGNDTRRRGCNKKNEEECRCMGNKERRVDWGRWVKVRAEEQVISSLRLLLLSLALIFPKDVVHVDRKARWLIVASSRVPEPLIFIVPISVLVIVRIPVSLFLWLGAGLAILLIVPLCGSFFLCCSSLKSHNLWQVWVIFPVLCRP